MTNKLLIDTIIQEKLELSHKVESLSKQLNTAKDDDFDNDFNYELDEMKSENAKLTDDNTNLSNENNNLIKRIEI